MPEAIQERFGLDPAMLPDEVLESHEPLVLRGLARAWPIVQAAMTSASDAAAYLRRFERPQAPPVVATLGGPETCGRVFYNDDFTGFNFRREQLALDEVLERLLRHAGDPRPPMVYVASTTIETWLPGFGAENGIALGERDPLASIWIGNRTRIAAHQDLPDNLACVAAGRRRVTLFPPEQLSNLYIGPLDFTPAGQAVSLVDFAAPDYTRFPRFAEALRHARVADLDAGDAVFIPSLWWHHMEALESFNILVNYWWRRSAAWMDTPMNTLMYALMTLRDLPPEQRAHWQEIFRHYVFEPGDDVAAHIPQQVRGVLSPMDERMARSLRARLLQRLNR